jgi:hypothetical protein
MYSKRCLGVLGSLMLMLLLTVPAMAQGGMLVRAEWGFRGERVDVTPQVRSQMHDGRLEFIATRQFLGDPAPGRVKTLMIRVRHWDGDTQEYEFAENTPVRLNFDPDAGFEYHEHGLHIMRAYYGGEGHFYDVTERLRQMKEGNRLFIRVDNRELGVDPDPGIHKVLRVLYFVDGQRRNIVVPEHAELRLP